jgi:hypothetical protein
MGTCCISIAGIILAPPHVGHATTCV